MKRVSSYLGMHPSRQDSGSAALARTGRADRRFSSRAGAAAQPGHARRGHRHRAEARGKRPERADRHAGLHRRSSSQNAGVNADHGRHAAGAESQRRRAERAEPAHRDSRCRHQRVLRQRAVVRGHVHGRSDDELLLHEHARRSSTWSASRCCADRRTACSAAIRRAARSTTSRSSRRSVRTARMATRSLTYGDTILPRSRAASRFRPARPPRCASRASITRATASGHNLDTGDDNYGDEERYSVRATFAWEPSEATRLTVKRHSARAR